jgi:hypothetical protein
LWFERSSNVIQSLVKFTRVLNTPISIKASSSSCFAFFLNKRLSFVRGSLLAFLASLVLIWMASSRRRSFPRLPLHIPHQFTLYLLVFSCSRWFLSLLPGLFLPAFYIFHPSLVVELAHLGVQSRARCSTMMRRPYSSVCRLRNVSGVAALCCWHGIFLLSILYQLALACGLNRCLHPSAHFMETSEKSLPSIKQWSIWLKVCPSGECQVWSWIRLCILLCHSALPLLGVSPGVTGEILQSSVSVTIWISLYWKSS